MLIVKRCEALIRRWPCAKYFLPKQIQPLCLLTLLQLEINSVYTHILHHVPRSRVFVLMDSLTHTYTTIK